MGLESRDDVRSISSISLVNSRVEYNNQAFWTLRLFRYNNLTRGDHIIKARLPSLVTCAMLASKHGRWLINEISSIQKNIPSKLGSFEAK